MVRFNYTQQGSLPGPEVIRVSFGINSNLADTANTDFRNVDRIPMGTNPYTAFIDSQITEIILSSGTTNNFSIKVFINDVDSLDLTRNNNNEVQVFTLATPLTLSKGDRVRVRFNGGTGSTNRPIVQLTSIGT